jgi:hypothetical protein
MNEIWFCKIGETDRSLPYGADFPMRRAVEAAYREITGEASAFIFSGWGGDLTESERAVADHLSPDAATWTAADEVSP